MSEKTKQTQSSSTTKNLLAGGMAGGIEATIMFPTEYVKTQLQLQSRSLKAGEPPKYSGVFDCATKIVREKGPLALYRGLSTLVVGSIPKAAVRFAAFAQLKELLSDKDGKMTPTKNMLAGLGAGLTEAVIAVTPTEAIKTQLIADQNLPHPRYRGLIHGTSTMIREGGIRSIYAGLLPTMLKQGGNQACRFTSYEFMKGTIMKYHEWNSTWAMICGAIAGGFSVYVTMPFDVVKTRMQGLEAKKYRSTFDCTRQIWTHEGVLAFWSLN